MDLDDWRIREALEALERRKHLQESYGIDFKKLSERFSSMNVGLSLS